MPVMAERGRMGGATGRATFAILLAQDLAVAPILITVTVLAANPEAKRAIDVWGKSPGPLDLMQSLKDQFDPARVLNPGRFAGRI